LNYNVVFWDDYFLFCSDNLQLLKHTKGDSSCQFYRNLSFHVVNNNCYYVFTTFDLGNNHYQRIENKGIIENSVTSLSRYFLNVNKRILDDTSTIRHTMSSHFSIGLQIRTLVLDGKPYRNIDCNTTLLAESISHVVKDKSDYKILFSTDSVSCEQQVKNYFGHRILLNSKYEVGHSARSRKGNISALFRGVCDIFCLSRCDEIIRPFRSSFGGMAAAVHGGDSFVMKHSQIVDYLPYDQSNILN